MHGTLEYSLPLWRCVALGLMGGIWTMRWSCSSSQPGGERAEGLSCATFFWKHFQSFLCVGFDFEREALETPLPHVEVVLHPPSQASFWEVLASRSQTLKWVCSQVGCRASLCLIQAHLFQGRVRCAVCYFPWRLKARGKPLQGLH